MSGENKLFAYEKYWDLVFAKWNKELPKGEVLFDKVRTNILYGKPINEELLRKLAFCQGNVATELLIKAMSVNFESGHELPTQFLIELVSTDQERFLVPVASLVNYVDVRGNENEKFWSLKERTENLCGKSEYTGGEQHSCDHHAFNELKASVLDLGIRLAQFMFQGSFTTPGAGNSGGVAVLLGSLGSAISDISNEVVITLSITGPQSKYTYTIEKLSHFHWHVGIRLLSAKGEGWFHRYPYYQGELVLLITKFFDMLSARPAVLHGRFADPGTVVLPVIKKNLKSRLVFTVTPDPHRSLLNMVESKTYNSAVPDKLHRIFWFDQIVQSSDALIRLPTLGEDWRKFYTVKLSQRIERSPQVAEGIVIKQQRHSNSKVFDIIASKVPVSRVNLPWVISVGRFSVVKQHHFTVDSFAKAELENKYNMLIIGGEMDKPNQEEAKVLESIHASIAGNALDGKVVLLGAISNEEVRALENFLYERFRDFTPCIYMCCSEKEEFGLAILEAMSAGMLTFAPIYGGPSSYIKHGVNGFLIDTHSIKNTVLQLKNYAKLPSQKQRSIAEEGRISIVSKYNINNTAKELIDIYLSL